MKIQSQVEDAELVERRRSEIIASATDLFGTRGYPETTIKDIAKRAGFSPGLVYSYVKGKDDVLFLVIEWVLTQYKERVPKAVEGVTDPLQRLRLGFRAYCEVAAERPRATLLAYRETKSLSERRRDLIKRMELDTSKVLTDSISDAIGMGWLRPTDPLLVTHSLLLLAHGWALKSWHVKGLTTLSDYIDFVLDMVLAGLATQTGRKRIVPLQRMPRRKS